MDQALDVGCGNGGSTCAVARTLSSGDTCRARPVGPDDRRGAPPRRGRGRHQRHLRAGRRAGAPVRARRARQVVSKFCVMFFADPLAAFANLARALRPGGRVAVLAWRALGDNDWMRPAARGPGRGTRPAHPSGGDAGAVRLRRPGAQPRPCSTDGRPRRRDALERSTSRSSWRTTSTTRSSSSATIARPGAPRRPRRRRPCAGARRRCAPCPRPTHVSGRRQLGSSAWLVTARRA